MTQTMVTPSERCSEESTIVHLVCECDEDTALCGLDRSGLPEQPDASDDRVCVVCVEIDDATGCPKCGE